MSSPQKTLTPCFILHRRPFRESSLIIDIVAAGMGLLSVVLRGAQAGGKGKSSINSALAQPFRPLLMTITGNGEMKNAYSIEQNGAIVGLQDKYLYSGFYVNELICRLCPKNIETEELFELYAETLSGLHQCQEKNVENADLERVLRRFELELLVQLGFGIDCFYTGITSDAIEPSNYYYYDSEHGFGVAEFDEYYPINAASYKGEDLLAIGNLDFSQPSTLKAAKRLCRMIFAKHLDGQPLKSRELFVNVRPPKHKS